jgi:superfamily I DNA/RNA helicase
MPMKRVSKIYGPPGTGKTTTLMDMVDAELKRGTKPERIGFVSFTRAACENARHRAAERLKLEEEQLPWFRTIHAVAYRLLEMMGSGLITCADDMAGYSEMYGVKFSRVSNEDSWAHLGTMDNDTDIWGDIMMQLDTVARNRLVPLTKVYSHQRNVSDIHIPWRQLEHFHRAYPAWKKANGLMDFTDLLEQCSVPMPVSVLFVDEAQDLSPLQWKMLDRIAAKVPRVYLAGDDDQALYSWSGANAQLFNDHPGDVTVLEQSYRVPASVHRIAERVASFIHDRKEKTYAPRADEGEVRKVLSLEAVVFDPEETTLVLYRNHYLGEWAERLMHVHKLPYSRQGKRTLIERWGTAIRAWESLRKGKTITPKQLQAVVAAMKVGHGRSGKAARLARLRDQDLTRGELQNVGLDPEWLKRAWYDAFTKLPAGHRRHLRDIVGAWGGRI